MRILFDLIYPGYLRYFDAPIEELARRGHEVEVWFVNERKQAEGVAALAGVANVHVRGRRPRAEADVHYSLRAVHSVGDYVRYLDPVFAGAEYLRGRASLKLPVGLRWLSRLRTVPSPLAQALVAASIRLDDAAPPSRVLADFVRERAPDLVVAAPGLYTGGQQGSLLAAARRAGIPTAVAVASWDNLTTKGLLRGNPDRVLVWNEALADEAVQLHRVPASRIRVTGAPGFDKWFGRSPSRTAREFAERVGLPAEQRYVLFVGSTASISAPRAEIAFVREWISALRSSGDPLLRELAILVRPHPYNNRSWAGEDLSDIPDAVVWPRGGVNPVDEDDRAAYFDSIFHCAAVVGINTSAMVEAAIVGRPVFSVTPVEFADTQMGTLHFKHLLPKNGGFLRCASSLDEHLGQLDAALHDPAATREELDSFVASFIRPLGRDRDATAAFVAELEEAADLPVAPPAPAGRALRSAMCVLMQLGLLDRRIGPTRLSTRLVRGAEVNRTRTDRLAARIAAGRHPARVWTSSAVRRGGGLWTTLLESAAARIDTPTTRTRKKYRTVDETQRVDDLLEIDG